MVYTVQISTSVTIGCIHTYLFHDCQGVFFWVDDNKAEKQALNDMNVSVYVLQSKLVLLEALRYCLIHCSMCLSSLVYFLLKIV